MAEGFLKSFDSSLKVISAGTEPSDMVHPMAIKVMQEIGIDISDGRPKSVTEFLDESFDYLITVCGGAKETCPTFSGKVMHQIHIGFDDPAEAKGTDEYILSEFRRVRDEINQDFQLFYSEKIHQN